MFNKIITLTLNPALDVSLYVKDFNVGDNIVLEESMDAAGKGVNVSRVLTLYGIKNHAIIVAGKENLDKLKQRMAPERIDCSFVEIEGNIRENLSIVKADGTISRLLRKGGYVGFEAVDLVKNCIKKRVERDTLVIIAGRLPDGVSANQFKELCALIKEQGGHIALDTSSLSLQDIIDIKPFIIKPNLMEAEALSGHPLKTDEDLVSFGKYLNSCGISHCLISLGEGGLCYTTIEEAKRVYVPEVDIASTVGAGDAVLAGFISGMVSNCSVDTSLKIAAAFGTAACMSEGTKPPAKLSSVTVYTQVKLCNIGSEGM